MNTPKCTCLTVQIGCLRVMVSRSASCPAHGDTAQVEKFVPSGSLAQESDRHREINEAEDPERFDGMS